MSTGGNPLAGKEALRNVHYIATVEDEPTCGDRTGSVSTNPANVGCPHCHPGWPAPATLDDEELRLLRTYADGPRIWDAASLYPLVVSLEDKGMLASRGGRRHALTAAGRRALNTQPETSEEGQCPARS